jgi:hypothetical protein
VVPPAHVGPHATVCPQLLTTVPQFLPKHAAGDGEQHSLPAHTVVAQSPPVEHTWPVAHLVVHEPPQSTSLSLPSSTPSRQLDATHTSLSTLHQADAQSALCTHFCLSAHGMQVAPPQSTSVSSPSITPSVQWLVWQVCMSAWHQVLVQSLPEMHALPSPHVEQVPPPQSTSVSAPSLRPSPHWLATHTSVIELQKPLLQSASLRHLSASAHGEQSGPPQSTSVSPGSSLAFWHDDETHSPAAEHCMDAQSPFATHICPTLQRVAQVAPPQSMSVSPPSSRPSVHVDAAHASVVALHSTVAQSLSTRQLCPAAHLVEHTLPQSTSVSPSSSTPSPQWLATHSEVIWLQNIDAQSALCAQCWPVAHVAQAPPQSTSLSPSSVC